jgi:SAM-dependent methyltransferase
LRQFGAVTKAGESFTSGDLRTRFGISDTYRGLVQRWLEMLAANGPLEQDGMRFIVRTPLPAVDPQSLVARSKDLFRDYPSVLEYMERCGTRLADVLTGRESPLETLFPGGSTALADALYGTSPLARYFNAIVRAAVMAAADLAVPNRPLRILEIGAGTGGTTSGLLPALPADRVRYCFTDVGALFLSRASERFVNMPFMTYRLLNIETHPREQGFAAHEYDVILAANVLHATRNLHDTLDHVKWLLAPSGALVMYEATRHPHWFDVTTGLISGWQRFDDDLRTDVPLIAPSVWERALLGRGYQQMLAFPADGTPAEVLGQHILIARGPAVAAHAHEAASVVYQPSDSSIDVGGVPDVEDTRDNFRDQLASMVEQDRRDALVSFVRDRVMRVLRLTATQAPDRQQRLMDLGIDSLMAVEFRNMLATDLRVEGKLPATLIFDYPTIDAIADYLLERTLGLGGSHTSTAAEPDAPSAEIERAAAELETMDDEEVEALLNKRLETL